MIAFLVIQPTHIEGRVTIHVLRWQCKTGNVTSKFLPNSGHNATKIMKRFAISLDAVNAFMVGGSNYTFVDHKFVITACTASADVRLALEDVVVLDRTALDEPYSILHGDEARIVSHAK